MSSQRAMQQPRADHVLATEALQLIPWFRGSLLQWYQRNGRSFPWREVDRTEYEVLVAEILLQRTTAAQVSRVYHLFLEQFPCWSTLARAAPAELHTLLSPLGLFRQKANVFRSLSEAMRGHHGRLPSTRIELQQLPGVGQYIASVILAVFFGKPEPMLDANMARVLERFWGPRDYADIRDDPYLQTLSRRVVEGERSLEANWAILDLASLRCQPRNPICSECPVRSRCHHRSSLQDPTVTSGP